MFAPSRSKHLKKGDRKFWSPFFTSTRLDAHVIAPYRTTSLRDHSVRRTGSPRKPHEQFRQPPCRSSQEECRKVPCRNSSNSRARTQMRKSKLGPTYSTNLAAATEFENQVRRFGLTKATCAGSTDLRKWCERNRNRCYIPEGLLAGWKLLWTSATESYLRRKSTLTAGSLVNRLLNAIFLHCIRC
jgi:hypothetical protein